MSCDLCGMTSMCVTHGLIVLGELDIIMEEVFYGLIVRLSLSII